MTAQTPFRRMPSGPGMWVLSALLGASVGTTLALAFPAVLPQHAGHINDAGHIAEPLIPLWLCVPFATLLGSIALMPFISERFWHRHFPDFAFGLGAITAAYYLVAFNQPLHPGPAHHLTFGQHHMLETALEYYSFIALIGGLYIASGGVLITVRGKGTPLANTTLLAAGALLANVVGTTGASVLLIRPFMRLNVGRLKPIHVVMFIFIVSNCGGALTPIGDPPLYLGYLKGVPFSWTLTNLWPMWATCIGMLLTMFFFIDRLIGPARTPKAKPADPAQSEPQPPHRLSVSVRGTRGIIALTLIIAGVFIDPMLKANLGIEGIPIGATFQIAVAITAYFVASRDIYAANEFSFFPVKEVGLLFIGIFATMAPALGFLAANGQRLGLDSPGTFYFATGSLSGVLDNAPTYLNFLQVAFGPTAIDSDSVAAFLAEQGNPRRLAAVSLGAVFFGAMTYIGNGPNFMVRAIAESSGLRMPSFFGYCIRSLVLLLPVLTVVWLIFFRG